MNGDKKILLKDIAHLNGYAAHRLMLYSSVLTKSNYVEKPADDLEKLLPLLAQMNEIDLHRVLVMAKTLRDMEKEHETGKA